MLKDKYVIITMPEIRSGDLGASGANPHAVPDIEVSELSHSEVQDLQQDRRRRLAPTMPWALIKPMATEEADIAAEGSVTWGVDAVRASISPFDGSGIVVSVLDTGIDLVHPVFEGVEIEQRNFTAETDDDINGHGTHCAGTIFGQDIEGVRIGVARNIKRALIGKVLGKGSSTEGLVDAIYWAEREGAHIVSMSLGIDFPGYVANLIKFDGLDPEPATSVALEAYRKNLNLITDVYKSVLSQRASGDGIIFVAASGNESRRPKYEIATSPPAAVKDIISVGALAKGVNGLTVANFSNTQVEIAAPGVGIISAKFGGGLISMSGTSMAAPHVAGAAALWAQKQFETDGQIKSWLLEANLKASGIKTPLESGHQIFENVGAGIVQAPQN